MTLPALQPSAPIDRDEGKRPMTPHEAMARAAEFVKRAGFVFIVASMKSDACYYGLPGRRGLLRIADHGKASRNPWSEYGPTIGSVTFPRGAANKRGFMMLNDTVIENQVAYNIGLYMIRSERT